MSKRAELARQSLAELKPRLFPRGRARHRDLELAAQVKLIDRVFNDDVDQDLVDRLEDQFRISIHMSSGELWGIESVIAGQITLTYLGPRQGLHLDYFYGYQALNTQDAPTWEALQQLGIRPRRFMVPVLRAFITDHLMAGRMVAQNTQFTLEAWGSHSTANDQEKLVNMYRTLGFEVEPSFNRAKIGKEMVPMQTTIGTFLAATEEGQAWKCDLFGYQSRLLAGEKPKPDRVTRVHATNGEVHI